MAGPATLADLRRFVQAGARQVGRGFTRPDEDWQMFFFVQSPSGIDAIMLDNGLFENARSKEMLGEVLRRQVVAVGAYRYALLLNTHMALQPDAEQIEAVRAGELRIEQIEGAIELLTLVAGDAETEEVWTAQIKRNPHGIRKLAPWEQWNVSDGHTFSGRFTGLNEYLARPR